MYFTWNALNKYFETYYYDKYMSAQVSLTLFFSELIIYVARAKKCRQFHQQKCVADKKQMHFTQPAD